jgi:hypothetical protein
MSSTFFNMFTSILTLKFYPHGQKYNEHWLRELLFIAGKYSGIVIFKPVLQKYILTWEDALLNMAVVSLLWAPVGLPFWQSWWLSHSLKHLYHVAWRMAFSLVTFLIIS